MILRSKPIGELLSFAILSFMLIYLYSNSLISLNEFIVELLISIIIVLIIAALYGNYFIINDDKVIVKNRVCFWINTEYYFDNIKEIVIRQRLYGIIGIKINNRIYSFSGKGFDKVCDSFIKLKEKGIKVTIYK